MKKKTIKVLSSIVLSATLVLGLVACGNSSSGDTEENNAQSTESQNGEGISESNGEASSESGEPITLTFYWGSLEDDVKQVWYDYFFDPFMEECPNVTIDFQCLPDVQETLRVQLAAESGPDIFMLDCFDVDDYEDAGLLLNLDSYSKQYEWEENVYDWALDAGKVDNTLYALPHSSEATCMYANLDLIKQLGFEAVPKTREEFVAICDKAIEEGIIPIEYGYSGSNENNQWIYEHYLTTYAGRENIAKLFKGEIRFDDPGIQGAFELIKTDWDKGYFNQGQSGAITNDEARAFFTNGQAVFSTEGTWLTLETVSPGTMQFDWECTTWPSMNDGVGEGGASGIGAVMAINVNTQYADLCAELLNTFYSNEQNLANAIASGYPTLCCEVDVSLYPDDMAEDVVKTLNAMNSILSSENVGYAPWSSYPSDTNIYLMDNIDKLYYDEYTIEQFTTEAQSILDKELEEGYEFVE